MRVAEDYKLRNLRVIVIANGWGAYCKIDTKKLEKRLRSFFPIAFVKVNSDLPFAKGLDAHYKPWEQ